jgi:hypothetical protein
VKGTNKDEQSVWRGAANSEARSVWLTVTSPDAATLAARTRARRMTGIILGALLGLAYGLVSQLINPIAEPTIPFYAPPAGPVSNVFLSTLLGAFLGALTCYPASAALGVLYGAAAALIGIFVYMLIRLDVIGFGGALIGSALFSVPLAWLTVPLLALLRWVSERQVDALHHGESLLRRALVPAALVIVMMVAGSFELLTAEARGNLRHTNGMLQQGVVATSVAALPEPLQGTFLTTIPAQNRQGYTLEWTTYDLDRFNELRPPSNFDQHAAVIARFRGNYYVVCVYPTPKQEPNCAGYEKLPGKAPERRDD